MVEVNKVYNADNINAGSLLVKSRAVLVIAGGIFLFGSAGKLPVICFENMLHL